MILSADGGGVREQFGEAHHRHALHPLQHFLQADPHHLDLFGLCDPAGDPVWQQEARPGAVRPGPGLAGDERRRHISVYVGQTQGDLK